MRYKSREAPCSTETPGLVFNYWFSVISQSLGLSGLCSRLNRGDGLLAAQVALDGQELQTDHEHRNHAPTTYMAVFQIGVATFGSPFAYCQLLAAVYRMLCAA